MGDTKTASPTSRSLPSQGAWIEIASNGTLGVGDGVSLPSQGAWIEIAMNGNGASTTSGSLPSQGAWIEILLGHRRHKSTKVAPLTGSVD